VTPPRASIAHVALLALVVAGAAAPRAGAANDPPPGFTALFNGADLDGWQALVGNPVKRAAMTPDELASAQREADAVLARHWRVENGEIVNDGHGPHLCTDRAYGDFELWVDWKISPGADSGIYLRGSPQVQVWDPVNGIDAAKVGSGGLYNNKIHRSTPLVRADRPAGEWNTFFVRMIGEHVTVRLNDQPVVDATVMENYWDRSRPIFPREQIELQTHGGEIRFRNVFIREIPAEVANLWLQVREDEGFETIFNGVDLDGWRGSVNGYVVEDGLVTCHPDRGGMLFTAEEYDDFVLRFEFRLPPGGNNGLAVRAPLEGNPAYEGFELQILDNTAEKYASLQPYQYHGSVYGVLPARRGYLRPVGEWNFQEVTCRGSRVTVRLNGTTILDTDLAELDAPMDGAAHPGLKRRSGHLGFMGHGDPVAFRNIRIKRLRPHGGVHQ
jgi:hypothetical protein